MQAKAVLIIGGSGYVGTQLALRLRENYKVWATYHSRPITIPGVSCVPLDVSNRNWVKHLIYTAHPDVIIYATGTRGPEAGEADAHSLERLDAGGPATVASVSAVLQPKIIYLSSHHVFDGHRGNYHELDLTVPAAAIGKAKLAGENAIRGKAFHYLIVRGSPLFGRGNGKNFSFLDKLRMRLDRGMRVELPDWELHSFAPMKGFADFVVRLVDGGPKNRILHYGGLTKVTHLGFARAFAKRFGYDSSLVQPMSGSGLEADYSLNSSAVAETLKVQPLLLEEGFDLVDQELVARF